MIVLGVNVDGQQDILSMTIVETETASSWMAILEDLRNRGARDIFFLCSDNLPGLDKAIEAIYPNSIRQICIVHQIRNSMKYVSYRDRKKVMSDIKGIYRQIMNSLPWRHWIPLRKNGLQISCCRPVLGAELG